MKKKRSVVFHILKKRMVLSKLPCFSRNLDFLKRKKMEAIVGSLGGK